MSKIWIIIEDETSIKNVKFGYFPRASSRGVIISLSCDLHVAYNVSLNEETNRRAKMISIVLVSLKTRIIKKFNLGIKTI